MSNYQLHNLRTRSPVWVSSWPWGSSETNRRGEWGGKSPRPIPLDYFARQLVNHGFPGHAKSKQEYCSQVKVIPLNYIVYLFCAWFLVSLARVLIHNIVGFPLRYFDREINDCFLLNDRWSQLYEARYKFGGNVIGEPITYSVRFVTAILSMLQSTDERRRRKKWC